MTADKWATPFDLTKIKSSNMPKVEIAYSYQDAGPGAITGFVQDGAKGIGLLELALSFSSDFNRIKGWFDTYGSGQVSIAN